jgi:hypothetical protein
VQVFVVQEQPQAKFHHVALMPKLVLLVVRNLDSLPNDKLL